MPTPLAPLSPMAVNARTPETASRSVKFESPALTATPVAKVARTEDEDEINWDDPASSPFVANVAQESPSASKELANGVSSSGQHSPNDVALPNSSDDDLTTTSTKNTKGPRKFDVLEDQENIAITPRPPVTSASPAKLSVVQPAFNEVLPWSGGMPSLTEENVRRNRNLADTAEATVNTHKQAIFDESEFLDSTALNVNEETNIDDTCFSTFSEVPNADMTVFAKLGQRSPTKQLSFDSVSDVRKSHFQAY